MSTLTSEQVTDWLHYTKEVSWQHCDSITRRSRRLTKLITVIDMAGFSLFGGDSRFYKCLGPSVGVAFRGVGDGGPGAKATVGRGEAKLWRVRCVAGVGCVVWWCPEVVRP